MNSFQCLGVLLQEVRKSVITPFSFAALTILLPYHVFADAAKPDCQCRAPGGIMKDLGVIECVDIVGTKRLVRCEMSQNNPYWKKVEGVEGCPALS